MRVNNDLFGNPNDSYNSLKNILMEAKPKHFQPREVRYNKYKHKFSPGIIRSIKYRDSLYRKLKKAYVLSPEYSDLVSNLRLYNAILKKYKIDKDELLCRKIRKIQALCVAPGLL